MTRFVKISFFLTFLSLTIAFPQINFHLTHHFNQDQSNLAIEHDCLRISAPKIDERNVQEIISFCLTESLSQWNISPKTIDQKLTFDELRKKNITSEQLYHWSASLDLIELYEQYLTSNQSSMSNHVFYNCTPPRFGQKCQYEFLYIPSENMTLNELIFQFYQIQYEPISLTCYMHLECDRGSKSICLDWTEICDGYVDCVNDQIDLMLDNKHRSLQMVDSEDIRCLKDNKELLQYMFLSSSCDFTRTTLIDKFINDDKPNQLSNICFFVFSCAFYFERYVSSICKDVCDHDKCQLIIDETCPEIIITTNSPIAFGHVYVGYFRQRNEYSYWHSPDYICYDTKFCEYISSNDESIVYDNKTCRRREDMIVSYPRISNEYSTFRSDFNSINKQLFRCNTIFYEYLNICNSSYFYHCQNSSKCIPIYHLCNDIIDCDYGDDENCTLIDGNCSPIESNKLFKCVSHNKCISLRLYNDGECDCNLGYNSTNSLTDWLCEDENSDTCDPYNLHLCGNVAQAHHITSSISFPIICDGYQELVPIFTDEIYHTDETECEYWICNNTYTRCDGFWNCFNGADEVGCDEHPLINCSLYHHICIKPRTFELICLPLAKANDDLIDCLGATDEPKICRSKNYLLNSENFYCDLVNNEHCEDIISLPYSECINESQTLFYHLSKFPVDFYGVDKSDLNDTDLVKYLRSYFFDVNKFKLSYFSFEKSINQEEMIEQPSFIEKTFNYDFQCHRGYPLRLLFNHPICLCPPSYYGHYCQYQNQRVSLTLQLQTDLDSRKTLFTVVILLIDNSTQRFIHSSQQLTFISTKHCQKKFNFYLTYSTRPKHSNQTYYVHIDIYEKTTLRYRASFYIPLHFPFLPVHRIAHFLTIPHDNQSVIINCLEDQSCLNGRCMKYVDDSSNLTFCHCNQGWHGKDCSIRYNCSCSSDSLCVGLEANNRSICICPPNKWGPRCYLRNTICESNRNSSCLNDGQCVLSDDNRVSEKFFCICPKGFNGDRCEIEDAKIIISFDKNISLSEVILVHFIEVQKNRPIRNGSTFQSIPLYQKDITIRWSRSFHIVFAELFNKTYYLIHVQKDYNRSKEIRKLLTSSDRCRHMSDYFNRTILNYHLIRRIKYYHLPCQNSISCFYDREHFCLCQDFGSQRIANCFEFNSARSHDCFKFSNCQNDGQCLQDDVHCPQTSRCICRECFYGSLCQFSSSLFDLSLDGIVGAHIQPNLPIHQQPPIIKTTLVLVSLMTVIALINGILSLITFQSKETRQVGCGYYLLGSTITTLLTSLMLILKFLALLLTQMSTITHGTFLICLNTDRCLNGFVAMERAYTVIKGIHFNKNKTKRVAKYVICILLLMIITSTIYDPIHRKLVDDEQNRIWCIVSYSSQLLHFNQFIHMFHFFVPFLVNILASLIIIILATKRRRNIQSELSYHQITCKEIQQHRHLLIAPFVLVLLSLPRLIISFVGGCMKFNRNPWVYLIGYLISFIPPMFTFVLFVLPSKLYRTEFRKTMKQYRDRIQKRTSCMSCFKN